MHAYSKLEKQQIKQKAEGGREDQSIEVRKMYVETEERSREQTVSKKALHGMKSSGMWLRVLVHVTPSV